MRFDPLPQQRMIPSCRQRNSRDSTAGCDPPTKPEWIPTASDGSDEGCSVPLPPQERRFRPMKFRAICFGLVALVSTTSGCLPYHNHPCWGFRLHPCATGGACGACAPCAPVCSSPIHHPILHKLADLGPGCPTCTGETPVMSAPAGYPTMSFPPIIGQPSPLPAPRVVPPGETPNPMPTTKPGAY